mmetsp:Transcript_21566/g.52535  ORF Transcript_21566/g.52535 Transcript_21566/m.52535 type:complete len:447 (-) Transcript_21566:115-1455(-)
MMLAHVLLSLQRPQKHGDHMPLLRNASAVQRREQGLASGDETSPTVHQLLKHGQIPPLRCQVQRGHPVRRGPSVHCEASTHEHPQDPHTAGGSALRRRRAAYHRRIRGTDANGTGFLTPLRHLHPSKIQRNPFVLNEFQDQPHRFHVPAQAGSGQRCGARYLRGRRALSWLLHQTCSARAQQHFHQAAVLGARCQVQDSRGHLEALLGDQQLDHPGVTVLYSQAHAGLLLRRRQRLLHIQSNESLHKAKGTVHDRCLEWVRCIQQRGQQEVRQIDPVENHLHLPLPGSPPGPAPLLRQPLGQGHRKLLRLFERGVGVGGPGQAPLYRCGRQRNRLPKGCHPRCHHSTIGEHLEHQRASPAILEAATQQLAAHGRAEHTLSLTGPRDTPLHPHRGCGHLLLLEAAARKPHRDVCRATTAAQGLTRILRHQPLDGPQIHIEHPAPGSR